jgi:hypothetical protein
MSKPIAKLCVRTRLATNGVEVIPSAHLQRVRPVEHRLPQWTRDDQIHLQNATHGCFLVTSLGGRVKEIVNRFNVSCGDAVWKAFEGVYFGEITPAEPEEPSDRKL